MLQIHAATIEDPRCCKHMQQRLRAHDVANTCSNDWRLTMLRRRECFSCTVIWIKPPFTLGSIEGGSDFAVEFIKHYPPSRRSRWRKGAASDGAFTSELALSSVTAARHWNYKQGFLMTENAAALWCSTRFQLVAWEDKIATQSDVICYSLLPPSCCG